MLYLFVSLLIIQKTQSIKNYKMYHRKWHFSIFMGFQNANENELHGFGNLVILPWKSFGKVMEIFTKEFVRTLI